MFKGKKVLLRAYEKEDIKKAHLFFNDLEFRKLMTPNAILPLSFEDEEKFILNSTKNIPDAYNFAISRIDNGEYIGGCGYFKTDFKNRTTWIGIGIGDKTLWGQGYGYDALEVLLHYLKMELNIRKVLLNVFSYNTRAITAYEKLGFVKEGQLSQMVYRDGQYFDEIIMAYNDTAKS